LALPALAGLIAIIQLSGAASAEVPDVIQAQGGSRQAPAWVSAKASVSSAGLDPQLFAPHEFESLQRDVAPRKRLLPKEGSQTEASLDQCSRWTVTTVDWENPRPNRTLPDLVANAKAIYAGAVEDSKQGFLFGQPGTLLEVKVLQKVKYPDRDPPETVLIFYPFAKIPVREGMICSQGDRGEAPPEIGKRILVFPYRTLGKDPGDIIYPDDEEVIFGRPGGSLSLPRAVQGLPPDLTFDEVLESAVRLQGKGS
jgi:hypothetical protein